jgi:transmembrane sensor
MTDIAGDIAVLIMKHVKDQLTEEERGRLMGWISESEDNAQVFNELTQEDSLQKAVKELYVFRQTNDEGQATSVVDLYSTRTNWLKYISVAVIFIAVVCMVWLYMVKNSGEKQVAVTNTATKKTIQDIAPGGNKAVLTLADGSTIVLDNKDNGVIAEQDKTTINKKEDGQLEYKAPVLTPAERTIRYNTITTPRGGQYQLTLPDGSKVWLNAASSLKFPVNFSGKERMVQLTGEAYFEVALVTIPGSGARMPFEVQMNNGVKVQVLSTHFNIMAYEDEKESKTTLLQGKVKVENGQQQTVVLQPGEQSLLTQSGLRVKKDADVAEAVAWKDGKFKFVHSDLKAVMRNIARWYDVQIEYDTNVPEKYFTGEISRKLNASEALTIIEFAGVHCKIEGRKIKVLP